MRLLALLFIIAGGHCGILAASGFYQATSQGHNILDATQALMYLMLSGTLFLAGSILYRLSDGRTITAGPAHLPPPPDRPTQPADQPRTGCSFHPGQKPRPANTTETYLVDFNINVLMANRWTSRGLKASPEDVHAWLAGHGYIRTPDGYLVDDEDLARFDRGEIRYCRSVSRTRRAVEEKRLQMVRRQIQQQQHQPETS